MTRTDTKPDTGLAARALALDILRTVLGGGPALDDALAADDGFVALDPRDRAFARMMVATTLRRLGQIDALIGQCLERPLARKADIVMHILRLGACQLLFLRTPAHAAVDAAVRMTTARDQSHLKGLVNAVLRRIARDGEAQLADQDEARLNTAAWMWDAWTASFGAEACRAIATAHLAEPPLDFSVKSDTEHWARELGGTVLAPGTVRRTHGGPITELPGYADGAWWVQDGAAALPARLLISGLDGSITDRHVIDLCAAPGGKTAQLACAGARVVSVDRSKGRLARLGENLDRLGLDVETILADATSWRPATPADAVLLDAPCTATGTIRRHPDIPHTKSAADVARLAGLQSRLLDSAADMVRPGGVLVYGVCSLQAEEGVARIDAFLSAHDGFRRLPVQADEIAWLDGAITPDGDLMTLPSHLAELGGLDGFYAARMVKT